jgi:PhzF family phenazine biosynthesis protein
MGLKIYQVDAFTNKVFQGNPAAVCVLQEPPEEQWMQLLAREMNLSETAFLVPKDEGFSLRWFTPTVEVALCGHATLASAHILWQKGFLNKDQQAKFYTKSGMLTADLKGDLIELNFPATPETETLAPEGLEEALGIKAKYVGKTKFDYILEVDSPETVKSLQPDFTALRKLPVRGIMVTSQGDSSPYDCISRFFAPGSGIDEDPVTGSAHCCLGPFWSARLSKKNITAYQASARGGTLWIKVEADRVYLSGHAVTVLEGELF